MLVCDSHNFIFIHIERTGGTSIRKMCYELSLETKEKEFFHTHVNNLVDFEILNSYKTFTFVRNPWDRALSWYKFLKKNNMKDKNISFEEFILNFEEINKSRNQKLDFSLSQYDYIYKDGNKCVDYIGRFENYNEDIRSIFSNFSIRINSIPKINGTQRKKYQEYYTPKATKYIEQKCYKDIEYFGYKF